MGRFFVGSRSRGWATAGDLGGPADPALVAQPPANGTTWPHLQSLLSEAKNRASSADSQPMPMRLAGTLRSRCFLNRRPDQPHERVHHHVEERGPVLIEYVGERCRHRWMGQVRHQDVDRPSSSIDELPGSLGSSQIVGAGGDRRASPGRQRAVASDRGLVGRCNRSDNHPITI